MQWKDKDSILKRLRNRIAVTATPWFNGGRNRRSFRPVMYMICEHKYVRMSDVHDMRYGMWDYFLTIRNLEIEEYDNDKNED